MAMSSATLASGRVRFTIAAALALATLAFLHTPLGRGSFVAEPDRAMLSLAYSLRKNNFAGSAAPIAYVRIGDADIAEYWRRFDGRTLFPGAKARDSSASQISATPLGTPRGFIANLLTVLRTAHDARMAVVDIDVAWSMPDAAEEQYLEQALLSWAHDPAAPLLVMVRETTPAIAEDVTLATPADQTAERRLQQLAPSRYDSIVAAAPNIVYAAVGQRTDTNQVAREFEQAVCALTPTGMRALPAVAIIAEEAVRSRSAAEARRRMAARVKPFDDACRNGATALPAPLAINYHIDFGPAVSADVANRTGPPPVGPKWTDAGRCGAGKPSAYWIPATEMLTAAQQHPRNSVGDFFCGAIILLGGNTSLQPDMHLTPYGVVDGPVLLANEIRGLLIAPDLSSRSWWATARIVGEIVMVLITVWVVRATFRVIGRARRALHKRGENLRGASGFFLGMGRICVHPITLHWLTPIVIFVAGAAVMEYALLYGVWGIISIPGFAAVLSETIFEWEADLVAEREEALSRNG